MNDKKILDWLLSHPRQAYDIFYGMDDGQLARARHELISIVGKGG